MSNDSYDLTINLKPVIAEKILNKMTYPYPIFRLPHRINIDPFDGKIDKMGINKVNTLSENSELAEFVKVQTEIKKNIDYIPEIYKNDLKELINKPYSDEIVESSYYKTLFKIKSLEIFRIDCYLTKPLNFKLENGVIKLENINILLQYELRFHYKLGFINSHVDVNSSNTIIESNIEINISKEGSCYYLKPFFSRLKFKEKVLHFKVTLDVLKYYKPDLSKIKIFDIDNFKISLPYINQNLYVKNFDLIINNNLFIGLELE
ncbi:MAG: hypothetical protein JXB88_00120 [Spirochaetales bacterium]|nr:hypothetical protein [Spirochaetales bacterium]